MLGIRVTELNDNDFINDLYLLAIYFNGIISTLLVSHCNALKVETNGPINNNGVFFSTKKMSPSYKVH